MRGTCCGRFIPRRQHHFLAKFSMSRLVGTQIIHSRASSFPIVTACLAFNQPLDTSAVPKQLPHDPVPFDQENLQSVQVRQHAAGDVATETEGGGKPTKLLKFVYGTEGCGP
jgi:hypothetical protein